jgi:hypothetical protein
MTVSFHLQQPALRPRAWLKSMHPSARKATALSSLAPLMGSLPPALPTNHHGSVREGASGSSALSASSTTVSPCPRLRRGAGAVAAGHHPATPYADKVDTKEERRDSWWRVCYGQIEAQIIEQLAKELEMPRGAFSYGYVD